MLLAIVDLVNNAVPRRQRLFPSPFGTLPDDNDDVPKTPQAAVRKLQADGRWRSLRDAAKQANKSGLFIRGVGEFSLRTEQSLIITGRGIDLTQLVEAEIIAQQLDFEVPTGKAPEHIKWHQAIYHQTGNQSVLYCHPVYVLALPEQATNATLKRALPEVYSWVGGIKLVNDLTSSNVSQHLKDAAVLLVRGKGLLCAGSSPMDVVQKAEAAHKLCHIVFLKMQVT